MKIEVQIEEWIDSLLNPENITEEEINAYRNELKNSTRLPSKLKKFGGDYRGGNIKMWRSHAIYSWRSHDADKYLQRRAVI